MFGVASIRKKLQLWVVAIFVLTGTAGWAGIWGLFYISGASRDAGERPLERARLLGRMQTEIAAARGLEHGTLALAAPVTPPAPAAVLPDAPTPGAARDVAKEREAAEAARAEAERATVAAREAHVAALAAATAKREAHAKALRNAWAKVAATLAAMREAGTDPTGTALLERTHAEVATSVEALAQGLVAGRTPDELDQGAFAEYDQRRARLDEAAAALADDALTSVRSESSGVLELIGVLQIVLFVTVALAQAFSAWAGWRLSRSLSSQLTALKDFAERISLGDLKSEVKIDAADSEVVEVGAALDRLRVSLAKAMERLTARRAAAHPPESSTPPAA